jgi:DNA-binding phage protein
MRAAGESLKTVAGLNGFTVTGLAQKVGKSRMTVYRAWKNPGSYQPTHHLLSRVLRVKGGGRG